MVWPVLISAVASVASAALGSKGGGSAMPTSADELFGPSMMNNDSSGWMINFGDGASSQLDNGNRGAPNQTPTNSKTNAPNGYVAPVIAPGNTGAALAASMEKLPWLYIMGGIVVAVIVWKKA